MFTSIDDVTPIDSNEVGDRVADFLQTAGQVALISAAVTFVLTLFVGIAVAKKAGYSGWWGALAVLVPPLGVVLALLFALLKWPALKERDEALGVLEAHALTLPSHERAAIKEAERKKQIEDEARRRMEIAQAEREKAEADRERFRAAQALNAQAAAARVEPEAKQADAPAPSPESEAGPAAAAPAETSSATPEPQPKEVKEAPKAEPTKAAPRKAAPKKSAPKKPAPAKKESAGSSPAPASDDSTDD